MRVIGWSVWCGAAGLDPATSGCYSSFSPPYHNFVHQVATLIIVFFIRVGPLYRNGKGRHKGEGGQHHDNHYWSLLCGPMAETETSPRSWLAPAVAFGEASGLWPLDAVKGFGGIEKPVVYSPSLWSKPCNMAPTLLEEG